MLKLPCRAQGRPKTRIVWDRVQTSMATVSLSSSSSASSPQLIAEPLPPNENTRLDVEMPVDLVKSKILSFRSKRDTSNAERDNDSNDTYQAIPDLQHGNNNSPNTRSNDFTNLLLSEFNQIMRDSNEATFNVAGNNRRRRRRRKRDLTDDDDDTGDDENSADTSPILFFSTQAPNNAPRLDVNDNGELILRDVSKKDEGWYACGALNEAGSAIKRVFVRVQRNDGSDGDDTSLPIDSTVNRFSNDQNIIINTVAPMQPYSLDVFWETNDDMQSDSLTVHYRVLGTQDFQTKTAMIDVKEFNIGDLKAHTEYEIFVSVPQGLGGSVSNIRRSKTFDGPPTAPPTDVRVGVINNTAAYVRWSPPPHDMLNGELTGYKVRLFYITYTYST